MNGLSARSLERELLTLCYCVSLRRADGLKLCFTSHDRPVQAGRVTYLPQSGFVPSAVTTSGKMRPDQMELSGAIGSAGFSELEVRSGKWREARVDVSLCDWSSDPVGLMPLFKGVVAGIRRPAGARQMAVVLELLSEMAIAGRGTLPVCSPVCRAEFGDRWCGIDLARHRSEVDIIGVQGSAVAIADPVADPASYISGIVRILTGPLAGIDRNILAIDNGFILMDEDLGYEGDLPCRARLTKGCDKQLVTCQARFQNVGAFLGQPHVPGTDALVRFGEG
mgnify:CR=1 FL=1